MICLLEDPEEKYLKYSEKQKKDNDSDNNEDTDDEEAEGKKGNDTIKNLDNVGSLLESAMGHYSCQRLDRIERGIQDFMVQNAFYFQGLGLGRDTRSACLIFRTASSLIKLHTEGMTPLEMVVIDEATQLKECESTIPLQLLGLRHATLIGDKKQLPAMVQRKICKKAEFGRILLDRLDWIYAPSFIGIPGENNELTFLCHWKFDKYSQTGDQINVSLPCYSKTFKMKEFRVMLTYDKLESDHSSTSTSEERVLAMQHTPIIHDYQFEESVMEGFVPSYQLETAGSGAGIEEEDNGDSIFDFDDDDEDEDATLAAIEELFERSW
ncbi:hypothetical protein CQW23_18680 [Capsicum baccatum]|uniref:DNA2/NAM7 helicase helicase domain-containing protein n=1 Tax=Capsicum baccatum TaxID=33114 RepID=A0A2G2W3M3_CAPBA|nr:hypothetical protein CQW23_18680 [Capsicum baccatum]